MSPPWPADFLEQFMLFTENDPSPLQFRLWTGIALVAGALERRVWAKAYARYQTFPNMYILLTAAPGIGKQAISTARHLWRETLEPGTKIKAFRVAPSQMTKAALIDRLAACKQIKLVGRAGTVSYNSLLIAAEEFQVLLPTYDTEYIATLNEVFNNPEFYDEQRRHGPAKEVMIEHPQLNILAGVQPSYFVSTFPEEAWTTGFARRILMIYAAEGPEVEMFAEDEADEGLHAGLLSQLGLLSNLYGQMTWSPEAAEYLAHQHKTKIQPQPEHSKLVHYNNSRSMFMIKLSMISAVARTGGLLIELFDCRRAVGWLLDAERRMPDVFREMIGKSDSAVIDELHYFVTALWAKNKKKPVQTSTIYSFMRQRVPSEKIEKILQAADRAGVVVRVAGTEDQWVPKPKMEHGVE